MIAHTAKVLNPTKDILIGVGIGVTMAMIWRQYKVNYFKKVDAFYREYDENMAKRDAKAKKEREESE